MSMMGKWLEWWSGWKGEGCFRKDTRIEWKGSIRGWVDLSVVSTRRKKENKEKKNGMNSRERSGKGNDGQWGGQIGGNERRHKG